MKCLRKESGKRYADALALAQDLQRYQAGEPILARPVGPVERTLKWVRRRPALAALLATLLLGAAAGLLLILWRLQVEGQLGIQAENQRSAAVDARRTAEKRRLQAEENLREARTNLYYSRLAQAEREWRDHETVRARRLLALCPEEYRAWEWHYLNRIFDGSLYTLDAPHSFRTATAFNPDGVSYAWTAGNQAKLFDLRTGKEILALQTHPNRVVQVAFSADGKRLATYSPGLLKVFDLPAGRRVFQNALKRTLEGDQIALSPDGKQIAYAATDKEVQLWNLEGGKNIALSQKQNKPMRVVSLVYSADGKHLAVATEHGPLKVLEVPTGREVLSLPGMTSPVAFSPKGDLLACRTLGKWDFIQARYTPGEVKVLQVQTGKEAWSVKEGLHAFSFSPDGQFLATAIADRSIRLWRTANGEEVAALRGHTGPAFP
jgi:WD40 repeat protein